MKCLVEILLLMFWILFIGIPGAFIMFIAMPLHDKMERWLLESSLEKKS